MAGNHNASMSKSLQFRLCLHNGFTGMAEDARIYFKNNIPECSSTERFNEI